MGEHKHNETKGLQVWTVAILLTLVAGCAEQEPQLSQSRSEPPYDIAMTLHETMEWVLEPAADVIWDSAGTIITAEGRQELAPTTDEGWAEVVRAATTLREASNLLMLPGRAAGDDWVEYSGALARSAKLAQDAASAQDPDALFDAGGNIYQVCRACHDQYWMKDDGRLE